MDPRPAIREFVARITAGFPFMDSDDLFAMSVLDSLGAMQLVTFVESTFEITVQDEDLDLDNFCSVDRIAGFVTRKRGF